MTQVADPMASTRDGPNTRHVHGHEPVGPTAGHRVERGSHATELLGHCPYSEVRSVRRISNTPRVRLDGVEIKNVAVWRKATLLMKGHCGGHKRRVSRDQRLEKQAFTSLLVRA
jgi:hypothetical protein